MPPIARAIGLLYHRVANSVLKAQSRERWSDVPHYGLCGVTLWPIGREADAIPGDGFSRPQPKLSVLSLGLMRSLEGYTASF